MTPALTPPPSLAALVCRPALPRDTADVMELTRTIWEGDDYVPHVWAEWLADPQGLLAVAEFGGRVVGLGKLSRLSPQDWWLEGLRVHPDLEGRGIASHIHDYLQEVWTRIGSGTIRLVTASFRVPVHRIAERNGFVLALEVAPFVASTAAAPEGQPSTFSPVQLQEAATAATLALESQTGALSAGLLDLGWQWAAISELTLAPVIEAGQAWWWRGKRGLLVFIEDDERTPRTALAHLVACQLEDLSSLLVDYRGHAACLGFEQAGWWAPLKPEVQALIEQAGFQRDWEHALFIYEKRSS